MAGVESIDDAAGGKLTAAISSFDDRAKLEIDSRDAMDTANQKTVAIPKGGKDRDERIENGLGAGAANDLAHLIHSPVERYLIEECFDNSGFGAVEVVNGLASHSALARENLQGKRQESIGLKLCAGGREDACAFAIGLQKALSE